MSRAGDDCGFTISIYNLNKATNNCSQQRARIKHQSTVSVRVRREETTVSVREILVLRFLSL